METKRIVITGMGAVTPLGIGVNEYWNNLIEGKCGISSITKIDTQDLPVKLAAEVKNFVPGNYMSTSMINSMDDFMQFAYVAADEALKESGVQIVPERTGIVIGTAMAGLTAIAKTQKELSENGKRVGPKFLPKVLGNIAATHIANANSIKGPCMTVSTACSSGGDAISLGAMFLKAGEADVVLVTGAESGICPLLIQSLTKALALTANPDPNSASRPFDLNRDGFVIGEGGGALVLETEEHALARGARIIAELAGYANNTDAYHVVAPHPEGEGAIACMKRALEIANMHPEEIGYINMHGTSTQKGDEVEVVSVKKVFDAHAFKMAVSSTKGATGHLMGAGGITEVIACIQAIRTGILPPTINYSTPDPMCDLDVIPNHARHQKINAAMSNAFGFGGQNSSIIVKAY
ncbi:beta-ketoacyl-[acyl-carrier-protein] synthase family protein [Parasporobacterium paucivorans]|uniref:3-oxoacyl-[acyl-carrier-protein] synthase 2 n=1 Tax=Parasporobacterium paucivorans DSM 15970 TaxID=1122934 RepID=A0A1M6KCY2_9FIRM|nr:beta-ketoacyl-[acyl-carrier-protein] synthase family protein [Parasporobacterium paucivorans]SHJ56784.1 3-oxoacyl-[acyl-carrier-protein] synthase II [Parasporobacterium paucivorans DSM 15970]